MYVLEFVVTMVDNQCFVDSLILPWAECPPWEEELVSPWTIESHKPLIIPTARFPVEHAQKNWGGMITPPDLSAIIINLPFSGSQPKPEDDDR